MSDRHETVGDLRAATVRGDVLAVDDTGALATMDVQTHDGFVRSAVEVAAHPWGFASVPPPGALAVLAAIGADPGDMMVVGVVHPGARLGGLAPGEAAIHDAGGNRVAVRAGGNAEVVVATKVIVAVGGTTVLQVTAAGIAIIGDVTVTGNITVGSNVTISGTLTVAGPIHGTADHAAHVP